MTQMARIRVAALQRDQIERLNKIKATRNAEAVQGALAALTQAAETGEGNLLDLSIQAIRLRATVGEVSDALEAVFGRHRADTHKVSGVYAAAYDSAETIQYLPALGASILLAPFALAAWQAPSGWMEWTVAVLLGVLGGAGHYLLALAHRYAPSSVIAPFLYQQVVYMAIFGYVVFGGPIGTAAEAAAAALF